MLSSMCKVFIHFSASARSRSREIWIVEDEVLELDPCWHAMMQLLIWGECCKHVRYFGY